MPFIAINELLWAGFSTKFELIAAQISINNAN